MVAVLKEVEPHVPLEAAESRVLLHNVSWKTYERLLTDLKDSSAPRLTYDRGELEIMSPHEKHEAINEAIKVLVSVLCEQWKLDVHALGSTTWKRKILKRGFEPDSCFYFKNASQVRSKDRVDLEVDPAPDLVVEVEITRSAIKKLPLFAKLGVPEVWCYDGRRIVIHLLRGDAYFQQTESSVLPPLTSDLIANLVNESRTLDRPAWLLKVRKWARAAKRKAK